MKQEEAAKEKEEEVGIIYAKQNEGMPRLSCDGVGKVNLVTFLTFFFLFRKSVFLCNIILCDCVFFSNIV